MTPAHSKTREEARRLFLTGEASSNAEIAARLGVKAHTIGKWRRLEDWDALRMKIDIRAAEMFIEKIATERVTLNVRHYRMWDLLMAKLADELKVKQGVPIRELERISGILDLDQMLRRALEEIVRDLKAARGAILLLLKGDALTPMTVWPEGSKDVVVSRTITEHVLRERKGILSTPASSRASACRIADCLVPSALVTIALRSRSAEACASMAFCIDSEGLMSWISTDFTVRPQSMASSATPSRKRALILSRFDKASSSVMSPMIDRRVVMIMLRIASEKSVTPYIALIGSVILMKAMYCLVPAFFCPEIQMTHYG